MKPALMFLIASLALLGACGKSESHQKQQQKPEASTTHAAHGPNDGELIELGDHVAHLEVVHDEDEGTILLYALDADLKPTTLTKAPVLNLQTSSGPKQLTATARGGSQSEWQFSDASLKGEPEGVRLRVVLDGVTYTPDLPHHHEGHSSHDGHNH